MRTHIPDDVAGDGNQLLRVDVTGKWRSDGNIFVGGVDAETITGSWNRYLMFKSLIAVLIRIYKPNDNQKWK